MRVSLAAGGPPHYKGGRPGRSMHPAAAARPEGTDTAGGQETVSRMTFSSPTSTLLGSIGFEVWVVVVTSTLIRVSSVPSAGTCMRPGRSDLANVTVHSRVWATGVANFGAVVHTKSVPL